MRDTQPVGNLVAACRTLDQAKAVLVFVEAIAEKTLRNTVVLTAARCVLLLLCLLLLFLIALMLLFAEDVASQLHWVWQSQGPLHLDIPTSSSQVCVCCRVVVGAFSHRLRCGCSQHRHPKTSKLSSTWCFKVLSHILSLILSLTHSLTHIKHTAHVKTAGFDALEFKEHIDYEIVQSTNPEFNKAVVRVNVFRAHRQTIQYIQPQDAQKLGQAGELLFVAVLSFTWRSNCAFLCWWSRAGGDRRGSCNSIAIGERTPRKLSRLHVLHCQRVS